MLCSRSTLTHFICFNNKLTDFFSISDFFSSCLKALFCFHIFKTTSAAEKTDYETWTNFLR
jgi:hypothetical protein